MEKITPFYNIFKVTHAFLESLSGHDQTYEAGFGLIVDIEMLLGGCQQNVLGQLSRFWPLRFFFNCYLAVRQPSLGHSQGDSLTNPMLIPAFVQGRPKGHWEPCSKVGSLSLAKHLAGFEPGTFWFWLQCLNPLGHSSLLVDHTKIPQKISWSRFKLAWYFHTNSTLILYAITFLLCNYIVRNTTFVLLFYLFSF